ncbi:STAS-like domain-containing protein [Vibrio atlanticus]|uniref:DUF4325 domain-containing protein n=1 Tax=Vibrio atlanticus TaxID=693153 RepID=A0A1C3IVN1_9VIBR|nr:STAS-like domain-containing protein [Vibrio atlanticus]SBS65476.1 hypothetical protein VAT7223_02715 [Vibrio atlanticus]
MNKIKIADRYPCPGPRYIRLGPASGQEFRESWLRKELQKTEPLTVDLDGTVGYGSSFLEEAFGGLIREDNLPEQLVLSIQFISTEEPELIEEIKEYIQEAIEEKNG